MRTGLPRRPGSFVGRGPELARIAAWLEPGDGWLLSILGPPGAGKTRLALEVAHEESALAVCWVEIRGTGASLAHEIAGAIGCDAAEDSIVRALRQDTDLLVLDGADGSQEELAETVRRLAARLSHLRIVVTARREVGVAGETLVFAGGLELPAAGDPLSSAAAGALFVHHLGRAGARLTPGDEADARRILQEVGQLPLAIELVAAQVAELGIGAFVARLGRPLEWLVRGAENPLARALSSAAGSLHADARAFLAGCAWLGRPFDLDDAQALAGPAAMRLVRGLRTSSWLVHEEGGGTYDLLPPVRQFVRETLDAGTPTMPLGSATAVLAGLARGRRAPADTVEAAFGVAGVPTAVCEAALTPAFHVFGSAGRGETYVRIGAALRDRGIASTITDVAVARGAIDVGRFDDASAALARLRASSDATARDHAAILEARLRFRTGDYDALRALSASLVPRSAEDAEVLAVAARIRGDHALGMVVYARALERAQAPAERAIVHALRARYLVEGARPDGAEQDLALAEQLSSGDPRIAASVATTRALVAHDRGELDAAIAHYDRGTRLYASLGSPIAAYVRCSGALATLATARREEACAAFLGVLDDAPDAMLQLQPFVALGRWLIDGQPPAPATLDPSVVGSSRALVGAYVARCEGRSDPAALESALRGNEPHEKWSVVSRALARLAKDGLVVPPPSGREQRVLLVGPGALWFAATGRAPTSLATRPVLARVLAAITAASERGGRVGLDEIAAAAWPGERMLERAKRSRVHVAISTLRKLGLEGELSHGPTGYRLELPIVHAAPAT